jgi:hypothetical protein
LASHFPTPSLVRAVPSLCIALATSVVHDSENRRARSSDLEMAYFTRQAIRPKGYYAALNACSSADLDAPSSLRGADVYAVERIVTERKVKPHLLYFAP